MEYQINLSDNHKNKLKTGYKNKIPVTIQLKSDQKGNEKVHLTQRQINKIEKCKKAKKGCWISLTHDQLKKNHSGGFLPLLFAGLGALGALVSGSAAITNSVGNKKVKDKELDEQKRHNKVMEGKGIKKSKK